MTLPGVEKKFNVRYSADVLHLLNPSTRSGLWFTKSWLFTSYRSFLHNQTGSFLRFSQGCGCPLGLLSATSCFSSRLSNMSICLKRYSVNSQFSFCDFFLFVQCVNNCFFWTIVRSETLPMTVVIKFALKKLYYLKDQSSKRFPFILL